jgi:hypothetical protein
MREANLDEADLQEMDREIRRSIDIRQYPIGGEAAPIRRTASESPAGASTEPPPTPPADNTPDKEQHE